MVQFDVLSSTVAVVAGCAIILLQYALGPFIMDLMLRFLYRMRWVEPAELPEHLEEFVRRVCDEHRMRFPSFGIIDDGTRRRSPTGTTRAMPASSSAGEP